MSSEQRSDAGAPDLKVSEAHIAGEASAYATAVVRLGPASLQTIGDEAAAAAGVSHDGVSVMQEQDSSGEPAYFFTYSIRRGSQLTGETRLKLARELRDRLLAKGDELYPYIRLVSH